MFVVLTHMKKKVEELAEGAETSPVSHGTVACDTVCLAYVCADVSWRLELLVCPRNFHAVPRQFSQY